MSKSAEITRKRLLRDLERVEEAIKGVKAIRDFRRRIYYNVNADYTDSFGIIRGKLKAFDDTGVRRSLFMIRGNIRKKLKTV